MPTANYAPELFDIFRKAAGERFELVLLSSNQAMSLRYRLNKLRTEMRKEQHYMLEVAESVSFIIEKARPNVLICGPADVSYIDVIRQTIGEPSAEAIDAANAMPAIKAKLGEGRPASQEDVVADYFSVVDKKE